MARAEELLHAVQELPHDTKVKVLVALTAVCMAAVLLVWTVYFNTLAAATQQSSMSIESPADMKGFSILGSIKAEMALAAHNIKNFAANISGSVRAGKDYEVSPKEQ